jgi:hypothetical protein
MQREPMAALHTALREQQIATAQEEERQEVVCRYERRRRPDHGFRTKLDKNSIF